MRFTLNNLVIFIGVLLIAFLIYWPCLKFGFLLYDDPEYVSENYFLKDFSWQGVINLFTKKVYDLYIPLTWLSYWIEINIFKFSAKGLHFSNTVLHALNSFLVFKLFTKLFKKQIPALAIAALFLVHPLHVESVAWIAERKDVLYTFFFLSALYFYIHFKSTKSTSHYVFSIFLFFLACLSKPMAVSLPVIVIGIDYFLYNDKTIKAHLNKIPFLIVSILFSLIAIRFINIQISQPEVSNYSFYNKLVLPFYELGFYIVKLLLPVNLSAIYPLSGPTLDISIYLYAFSFLLLLVIAFFKGNKYVKLAFIGYIGVLLPVLQLIPNANALVADRYTYVSSIFLFALICFWLHQNAFKKITLFIFSLVIIGFSSISYARCMVWKNDDTLFTNVLTKNKNSYTAYANLGMHYLKENNINKALVNLKQAADLKPANVVILTNFSWALAINGQADSSIRLLIEAVDIDPFYFKAWNNLGVILGMKGKYKLSEKCLLLAKKLNGANPELYYNLAITYANLNQPGLALECYKQAAQKGLPQARQFLSANNLNW